MRTITLNILSTEKELFYGEVSSVTLPGKLGLFTILPHHAPLLSSLVSGNIVYIKDNGEETSIPIKGGLVEFDKTMIVAYIDQPEM